MQKFMKFSLTLVVLFACGVANANIVYDYVSKPFDVFVSGGLTPLTLGKNLTISAEFAGNSVVDGENSPLNWKISDGLNTLNSNALNTSFYMNFFQGDAQRWVIRADNFDGVNTNFIFLISYNADYAVDQSYINAADSSYLGAYTEYNVGKWTSHVSEVPLPAGLPLILSGLGFISKVNVLRLY
jgi:hypothetical protein